MVFMHLVLSCEHGRPLPPPAMPTLHTPTPTPPPLLRPCNTCPCIAFLCFCVCVVFLGQWRMVGWLCSPPTLLTALHGTIHPLLSQLPAPWPCCQKEKLLRQRKQRACCRHYPFSCSCSFEAHTTIAANHPFLFPIPPPPTPASSILLNPVGWSCHACGGGRYPPGNCFAARSSNAAWRTGRLRDV